MTEIRQSQEKTYAVQYGDRRLPFRWRLLSVDGGKARIHVYPDGLVEVETPQHTTLAEAKKALLKRARWVTLHLTDIEARRAEVLEREYVSGETVFYLGRRYRLKIVQSSGERHVKMLRGQVRVTTPNTSKSSIKRSLYRWYRDRANDMFARRIAMVGEQLSWIKERPSWSILDMKTQWGSCSPSGTILLNPHLIKTPTRCIDYVILHELCHLKEHNHSRAFYRLITHAMPDWERVKADLDRLSELYLCE